MSSIGHDRGIAGSAVDNDNNDKTRLERREDDDDDDGPRDRACTRPTPRRDSIPPGIMTEMALVDDDDKGGGVGLDRHNEETDEL